MINTRRYLYIIPSPQRNVMSVASDVLQSPTERQANTYENRDLLGMIRSADRGEDRSAYHDSGDQEDIHAADYSSSSEGFLDLHERGEDFLLKGLPPPYVGPRLGEPVVENAPPMAAPARAPIQVQGPYESMPERGVENTAIRPFSWRSHKKRIDSAK